MWFKVDDGFHASKKLIRIPKRHRFAAAGLWAIAGSWCGDQLTDGHVPDYMLEEWGATPALLDALVGAGLWERESAGYVFCKWSEYQPSKEDVDAERAASRERMRNLRARRKGVAGDTSEEKTPESSGNQGGVTPNSPEHVTEVFGAGVRNPDPTRPDLLRGTHLSSQVTSARGAGTDIAIQARSTVLRGPLGEAQKTTLRVVGTWERSFENRPAQSHINDVTEQVQKLVNEGISETQISDGLQLWMESTSFAPSMIPTHVAKAGRPKLATGTKRAKETLELVRQLEMEEDGEPF